MTACPACTCADALQNPARVSADAHRHYLPDIAEPMLIAPESRVVCLASCVVSFEIRLSALSAASVRRVSVMTAQMPYPSPTIVPESSGVSTRLLSVPAAQLRSQGTPQIRGKLRHPCCCE